MANSSRGGVIIILIGVVGYVLFPILVKYIQPSGLQPLDIAAWRFVFATPVIWLILLAMRSPVPEKPLPRRGLLGLGVLIVAAALCALIGLEHIMVSTLIVLFYTYPAMVALINFALGERLPLQTWLALALTLVGVALTVPDFGAGLTADALIGIGVAILNALVVAVYFILNNRLMRGHNAMLRASAWTMTGAFLTVVLLVAGRGGVTVPPDPQTWLLLLAMAVVSTVLPVFAYMVGIQRVGASRAAIISTVEPIGTMLLAALLLAERIQPVQALGGALVFTSVILLQVRLRKPAPAVAAAGGD